MRSQYPSLSRPLGFLEEAFAHVSNLLSPINVVVAVEINGRLELPVLQDAYRKLFYLKPRLAASFAGVGTSLPRFETIDLNLLAPIQVAQLAENSLSDVVRRELALPFPLSRELLRCNLLTSEHSSILLLTAHHALLDGRGALYAIEDLLVFTTGKMPDPEYTWASNETMLGLEPFTGERMVTVPAEPFTAHWDIDSEFLASETVEDLTGLCRERKTTLHGAITAATYLASVKSIGNQPRRPMTLVHVADTRPLLDTRLPRLGTYITLIADQIDVDEHVGLWDIASDRTKNIRCAFTRISAANSAMAFGGLLQVPLSRDLFASLPREDFMISNYGRPLIKTHYDSLAITKIMPFVSSKAHDTISIATAPDGLFMSNVSLTPSMGLLKRAADILRQAVD